VASQHVNSLSGRQTVGRLAARLFITTRHEGGVNRVAENPFE
jgi:hypothetical protein